jgi:DNA mismatch repair ATPase MutS
MSHFFNSLHTHLRTLDMESERERIITFFDWNSGDLSISFTVSRGYHLSISRDKLNRLSREYQNVFIQKTYRGKRVFCTTELFLSLNSKQSNLFQDLIFMSGRLIESLMVRSRSKTEWIAQLAESIAWLDLVTAFATVATQSGEPWVRPQLSEDGDNFVKDGRHPLLDLSMQKVVPNDWSSPKDKGLMLITGANGSGKTTYLRTVGCIAVLAHIGSFVPASQARIRLMDKILTKMNQPLADIEEHSSFMQECKDLTYIIQNANCRSLVLVSPSLYIFVTFSPLIFHLHYSFTSLLRLMSWVNQLAVLMPLV